MRSARNFVSAMALTLDQDELALFTGSGNADRNERIRTAFFTWAMDYADTHIYLEDAWSEFIAGFLPVSANRTREVLHPKDIKEFSEFFNDLRSSEAIPLTSETYTITLCYDPDGVFKGAWFSCNNTPDGAYFFIWVDTEWAWEQVTSMGDVLANAFRAANSPQIEKRTYRFNDDYALVYSQVHYKQRG